MNKYANTYLDTLKEKVMAYRPFNANDAVYTGVPTAATLGAVAGGGLGALSGLTRDPGYDEEGRKKSRIKESIKGLLSGGAIGAGAGALGAAALPPIGSGAINLFTDIMKDKLNKSTEVSTPGKMIGSKLLDVHESMSKFMLPQLTNKQLTEIPNEYAKLIEEIQKYQNK